MNAKQRITLGNLTEPQQLRELNRQLEWIWNQLLGGLSEKSLSPGLQNVIDSKADTQSVNELDGAVTGLATQVAQNAGSIALKASQTDLDALGSRVDAAQASLTVQAAQIASKVSQTDLAAQLESYSTLEQTGEAITAAVGNKLDKDANAAGLDTGDGGVRVLMTKDSFDVNVPGEAGDMHLDENGAAMNTINAQTVNSPSVTAVYTGPSELTVGTGDGELRTLQEAFSLLNDRFLTGNVTISCGADAYGAATLRGVSGSGQITIAGNGHTNYGSVNMERCKTGVYAENLNVVNSEGADQAVLMLECAFVQLHGCAINGGGAARALTMFYGVKAMVWDCGLYNAESLIHAGHCCDLSAIVMRGGTCTNFLHGDGCTARISGTRPDGALKTDNPCLFAPSDPAGVAIDYGSAQPVVPETASLTARAHETGTYYPTGHWFGSDSDMRQGLYDTTQYAGCMWFDLSALAGKTVKSASLTLTRVSGVGKSGAIELTIWVTRLSGKSGNALSGAGSYGAIGSIRNGETLTLGIPAAAVQELIDGTAGGLMLYAGDTALISGKKYSANYGKMSGADGSLPPRLTITCQ